MNRFVGLIATAILFSLTTLSYAQNTDELKARFVGRSGNASEDRRSDDFTGSSPFRIKTGCHGDTFSAGVTITNIEISTQGNIATCKATYSGQYTRQGWGGPCVQTGHEDLSVSGTINFSIKQIPFKNAELTFGGSGDFGEKSDPGHDSNIFAVRAAQNAIRSAM